MPVVREMGKNISDIQNPNVNSYRLFWRCPMMIGCLAACLLDSSTKPRIQQSPWHWLQVKTTSIPKGLISKRIDHVFLLIQAMETLPDQLLPQILALVPMGKCKVGMQGVSR